MNQRARDWLVGIAIGAVATLAMMVLLEVVRASQSAPAPLPEVCMPDAEVREKIRAIVLVALDESLKLHVERMYQVWMKDDHDQPQRAGVGVRQGIRAYVRARDGIVKWNPPSCQGVRP